MDIEEMGADLGLVGDVLPNDARDERSEPIEGLFGEDESKEGQEVNEPEVKDNDKTNTDNGQYETFGFDNPESFEDFIAKELDVTPENRASFFEALDKLGVKDEQSFKEVSERYKENVNKQKKEKGLDEETLRKEYSKLSQEELADVDAVVDFLQENMGPEDMPMLETMLKTANGFRTARKMFIAANSNNIPNTHKQEVKSSEDFSMNDYMEATNKIREAESKLDFTKVEHLKKQLKENITRRGTTQLRQDLSDFINN